MLEEGLTNGLNARLPDFSSLLRGLVQSFALDQKSPRRVSLLFFDPPDPQTDKDIHGALNALRVGEIACDFVFLSTEDGASDENVSHRLSELAFLVSSYSSSCSFMRVRSMHALEDMTRLRSCWYLWAHPSTTTTKLRLQSEASLEVCLIPLLQSAPTPEPASVCSCHNLLVSRPARCVITGRKPTEHAAMAYSFQDLQFKAGDVDTTANNDSCELTVLAAIPSSGVDACYVLGSPMHLTASTPAVVEFLAALANQMTSRDESLVIKLTSRFHSSMHMASVAQDGAGAIVLVRVATREDILMLSNHEERKTSIIAERASSALLDALPRPSGYNPLAYTNQLVARFRSTALAELEHVNAAAPSAHQAVATSALSKKMVRLNLQ